MISAPRLLQVVCLVIVALAGGIAAPGPARSQNALGIAAVVNDDVISAFDLDARIWLTIVSAQMENTPEARNRLVRPVLRDLVDEKLKMQEAERLKVVVSQEDLDKSIATLEQRNNLPPGGMDTFLAQNGIDRTTLFDQMEAEIAWVRVVRRALSRRITVSDEEIDERLNQMKANTGRPERRVWEIYLPVESPGRERDVAQLATRLHQEILAKRNFRNIARNFSRSPSAAQGGDLGWVAAGQLHPQLESVLSKMKPGELSAPFRALDGYYIFVLADQRTAPGVAEGTNTVLDLRQVYFPLPPNADDATVAAKVALARDTAASAKNCTDMDGIIASSASALSGSLGKVPLGKLSDALRGAVTGLDVGTPSEPVRTRDGIVVLMVCSREGDDATASARKSIADQLFNQRLLAAAEEYLRDLRRNAYVDVRL